MPRVEVGKLIRNTQLSGRSIGSALIDMNFHHIVSERLNMIRANLNEDPDVVADRMVHGRFERIKCSYGTAAASALPTIPIEIPGLDPGYSLPVASIEDSRMIVTGEELKLLFDTQVDRMLDVIDEQFDRMNNKHPGAQIVERLLIRPHVLNANSVQGLFGSFRRSWKLSICWTAPQIAL